MFLKSLDRQLECCKQVVKNLTIEMAENEQNLLENNLGSGRHL